MYVRAPLARPTEGLGEAQAYQNLSQARLPRRCAPPGTLQRPGAMRHRPKTCPGIDFRGAALLRAPYRGPVRCAIVPKPGPGSTCEAPRFSEHPTEAPGEAPSSQNLSRDRLSRRRALPCTLRKPRARRHRPRTCSEFDFRIVAPLRAPYGSHGRGAVVHERVPSSTFGSLRPSKQSAEAPRTRLWQSCRHHLDRRPTLRYPSSCTKAGEKPAWEPLRSSLQQSRPPVAPTEVTHQLPPSPRPSARLLSRPLRVHPGRVQVRPAPSQWTLSLRKQSRMPAVWSSSWAKPLTSIPTLIPSKLEE